MPDDKIFSEQEVGAIVRRAVELQEKAGSEYKPGVTREELGKLASEIGVDPKFLDLAINEAGSSKSVQGPLNLTAEFQRVIDKELAPEDFDILLKHLRRGNRRHPITQVGRSLTGQAWTGASLANVDVSSRKGRTKVTVKSTPIIAYLAAMHAPLIGSFIALSSLAASGNILLGLAIVLPILLLASLAFGALVRKGHQKAHELADKLTQEIEEQGTGLDIQNVSPAMMESKAELNINA